MPLGFAFYVSNNDPLRAIYSAHFHSVWAIRFCPHIMKHVAWEDTINSDITSHARISTMNLYIPNTVLV